MARETYEKIHIETKSDLPKEKGKYQTDFKELSFNPEDPEDIRWWLDNVTYWKKKIKPLPALTEEEIEEWCKDDTPGNNENIIGYKIIGAKAMQSGDIHRWIEKQRRAKSI